jgi:hypothetical protein
MPDSRHYPDEAQETIDRVRHLAAPAVREKSRNLEGAL